MKIKFRQWAHHYALSFWLLVFVHDIFAWATTEEVALFTSLPMLPAMLFFACFGWSHYRDLCIRCIRNTPDHPEQAIEQRSRALRSHHWVGNHPLKFGAIILGCLAISWISIPFDPSYGVRWACNIPVDLIALQSIIVTQTHQRLAPWCPWCKGWEYGGEHETIPDPVPSGEKKL